MDPIHNWEPSIFRQSPVCRGGETFQLLTFRTATVSPRANGLGVTRGGDARVTPTGRRLRKWKLDEPPRLLNVIYGDCSSRSYRMSWMAFYVKRFSLEGTSRSRLDATCNSSERLRHAPANFNLSLHHSCMLEVSHR